MSSSFIESPTKGIQSNPNATNAVGHLNFVTVLVEIVLEHDKGC